MKTNKINSNSIMNNIVNRTGLFLLMMWISIGSAYATNAAGTYTLQKGANNSTTLDPGQYVICIKSTNMYAVPGFAGEGARNIQCENYEVTSYMTGSYYQRSETCTLDLDGSEGITEWTITENLGSYLFFDGTYYICGQSSSSNKLLASTSSTTAAEWSIKHTGTTYTGCVVRNDEDVTYEYCRGNGTLLSGYTSSGQNLYFFKKTATLYDITLSDDYANGGNATMDARVGGVSVTKAAAGATVTISQTPNVNFCFDSWIVYDEDWDEVTVTNNTFTMPAKDVTVYPTYTACGTNATVTAASSESISQTTATVRCASGISSKGDACCAITEYGFVISAKATNSTPTIGGSGVTKHQIGTSYTTLSTAFSKALTSLTASTTYCVRAYAINGYGTAYSAVHEFTTAADVVFGNYVQSCSDYHTVTYDANTGGGAYTGTLPDDDNEYAEGATVYVSEGTIGRTGYDFVGWNTNPAATVDITEFEMGASDATLYAIWSPIDYTLTMATSVGGGAGTTVSDAAISSPRTGAGTVTGKHIGDEITVMVVVPAHHTFTGWTSSNGGSFANASATSTTFTMPAGNTTVTASFTEDTKYTVTWSDNGDANTESVYSGETTTFPALMSDCDLYVAAGWVQDNSNTFTSETMTAPGTIYAVGATTPAVSANVTYKAVYRHKVYTNDEFELNETLSGGYYLSANPGTVRYSGSKNGSKLNTVTSTASAVPVYLEKEETGKYSFKLVGVSGEQYLLGNSSTDFSWNNSKTGDYKWNVSAGDKGKGDWHIVAGTNSTRGIIYNNSSGNYIGNYAENNVTAAGTTYYDINFVPAYYYMYSPTAACYTITIASNAFGRGDFATIDGSHKLQGNELTVTPHCGYAINSVNISNGTFTATNNDLPSNEAIKYTIIPTGACTFTVNFTTENDAYKHAISFLDGATTLSQTKTAAIKACGSVTLPNGYNSALGAGGACDYDEDGTPEWIFDGWTATEYTFGQMVAPSSIIAAGSSQTVSSDQTWYAVYHKTYAAGDYFKLKYEDNYVDGINISDQFTLSADESQGLLFQLENDYLYYIDKTTRAKKWVYYGGTDQRIVVDDNKPTSNSYKTTITANGGKYEIKSNGRWLEYNSSSSKVVFYATTSADRRLTTPAAASFTAYYPKTECAIEYVTVTYDAGAGNSCTPASASVEAGATFTLPVESDITYDNTDWTFVGWSTTTISSVAPGAPVDLILGGGSYSTFTDVTLHAVYSQTPPDGTFDNTSGGRYIIWGEDGGINYYATSNGQVQGKLANTLACSRAAIFEFVETETAGQYKIHISGEAKYMGGEGCADANTDFIYTTAASAPIWTVASTANPDVWTINSTCGNRGFIFQNTGSRQFGHYASNNTSTMPETYKNVHIGFCDDFYTTNPNRALNVTGDVKVTSTNGRMIMAKDQLTVNAGNIGDGTTITVTSNSSDVYFSLDRNANIAKAAASQPKTSISFNADEFGNKTQTVYVHYMPSVSTNGIEEVEVSVTAEDMTSHNTIKVRHLPAQFAIAAKVGTAWYALTGNMNGPNTPKAIQIDVDESTWTAYAPDTCAYQLWPVKTTSGSGDRYQTQGEKVRFSAVNNTTTANAGLWANNSGSANTINNNAAITAIGTDLGALYEWKISATEVSGTWKYTLQTDQSNNTNKLNIHRDENLIWGTYADGQAVTSDIYLLPISVITPFEFQVVEWYPTKMLIQTENSLTTPTVKIAGETVAETAYASKGGKLWEISNMALTSHPTEVMTVSYTSAEPAVTYTSFKTIPVILSRSTQDVTAAPFSTLTKEVYNTADLVVRDGSVLTLNGTDAENTFYDVTIYPTSKISVPEGKKISVHKLSLFGGIDEIYNGSSYDLNKYGVPALSLKGTVKGKTVSAIDYIMRVDLSQMYSLTLPYDVPLANITYWDGTAMTPGSNLYVSAYDGEARVTKSGKTWIYETDFASKFGEAALKAGVGYTISAELQSGVGNTYSIIRMPMTGLTTIAPNNTEVTKTVAVRGWTAEGVTDNNKGWNLVGNPYMVSITGSTAGGADNAKLAVGHLVSDGASGLKWETEEYRYVTMPADNGLWYEQVKWTDVTLPPFKNFFLQVVEDGDLTFALDSRQNMPALYRQKATREVEFEILLDNEEQKDHMCLLIGEKFTPEYEINADLEKMENVMSVYTLTGGYKLAYNALSPNDASQPIPVGFVANVAGDYTFSLDERSDVSDIEHIWLTDHEVVGNFTTDLLDDTYSFGVKQAGRNETRFTLRIEMKDEQEVPTDIGNVQSDEGQSTTVMKFLYRDKLYILRNGVLYDATGKKVK